MYYFLGFKLYEDKDFQLKQEKEKDNIAANTYILALDGDVDFLPDAVIKVTDMLGYVTFMKFQKKLFTLEKNSNIGSACGRIHPTGSGFIPAYQKFEYSIGHWLQKSTEHILGCVLCSPGCFSIFRGLALMENNVMRTYATKSTEPRHFVQFDQGEDRWLCTLMLKQVISIFF